MRFSSQFHRFSFHRFLLVPVILSLTAAAPSFAQFANPQNTTPVHNSAPLHPPAGARVAIVEFYDLECPDCAQANPVLMEAVAKYHIPWVRHDFPLPFHNWSFQAAVDARWFDTKSRKIGNDFRDAVFADQPNISTKSDLLTFAQKFASEHKLAFPFVVDPQGKLAGEVKADYALGESVGILHTPTIWIVTNKRDGVPYMEVTDRTRLFDMIDQALAETK